jgi:hypothetical protein
MMLRDLSPETTYWISMGAGIFLSLASASGLYFLMSDLRRGSTKMMIGVVGVPVKREQHPIVFWFSFVLLFAGALGLAWLAFHFFTHAYNPW